MAFSLLFLTDNCSAIVLSIAILLSGLRVASGAPAANEQEWWINPCNKQTPLLRHSRSPAENQLQRFLLEMDHKFFKDIKSMYKYAANVKFKGNCPQIKKALFAVRNATSFTSATQAFYDTLLQFAIFIDKLKDMEIKTEGDFDVHRRKLIFEEAKENLRLLICEYNDTLSNSAKTGNHRDPTGVVTTQHAKKIKFSMKCLPKKMDHTYAQSMDIDFFKKLKKFLKQGKRSLRAKKPKRVMKKQGKKKSRRTKT